MTKWKPFRDENVENKNLYPFLMPYQVSPFRNELRNDLVKLVREAFPSLSETDKPVPPDDWTQE